MRPAGCFLNASRFVDLLESCVTIRLQRSNELPQVCLRVFSLAIRRVGEPHRRWCLVSCRPSNPFLYFGRRLEFIVRRCFFPYALLVFALFNLMNVAFVLSVIGANLVWPIALYSSRAFARPRSQVVENRAASSQNAQPSREYAAGLL